MPVSRIYISKVFHFGIDQHSHHHWSDTIRECWFLFILINCDASLYTSENNKSCQWHKDDIPIKMISLAVPTEIQEQTCFFKSDDNTGIMPYRIHNFPKVVSPRDL